MPDGTFWPLAWYDSRHIERLFRAEVLLDNELITEATRRLRERQAGRSTT